MAGVKSGYRARLFRAVHAEAVKRRMDHDALHDMCRTRFGISSMGDLQDHQLLSIYHTWTGKKLRRTGHLPKHGERGEAEIVSGPDLELVAALAAELGMNEASKLAFLRRQLKGRQEIRTRREAVQVIAGLRAIQKRRQTI